MKIFVKVPVYNLGSDGQVNWSTVSEFCFNRFQIVGIEKTFNDYNSQVESMFWTTDDGTYYSPLELESLVKLFETDVDIL